jgi:hypothetical protein
VYVVAVPEEATNSSSAGGWEAAGGAPALQMLQASGAEPKQAAANNIMGVVLHTVYIPAQFISSCAL